MFKLRQKKDDADLEITIGNRTVIRVLFLVVLFMLFFAALRKADHALILIFIAFFLAVALNAPVHWLASHLPGRTRGDRGVATAASAAIVVLVLVGFLASVVPPIAHQTSSFIDAAPGYISDIQNQNGQVGKFVQRYHLQDEVSKVSGQLKERLNGVAGSTVSAVTSLGSSIFAVLTVLVLTFMMLVEGPHWVDIATELIPTKKQGYARELGHDMYHVIRGYVNGQVILAALASALIVPALFILHISYPIALMFVVFVCGLIPMVGHTIGAFIVTLVALFHSIPVAIIILAYYILYQQIENYLIQPHIQANTTNLSPLLVFVAVVVGVSFDGLLGGLVAIPLMGCLRVIVVDQLNRRHLVHELAEE
jgi:predicted PurR-regulated permease PerM